MSLRERRIAEADHPAPSLAEWVPRALRGGNCTWEGPERCMGGGGGQGLLVEIKYW